MIQTCAQLLQDYAGSRKVYRSEKLKFSGVQDQDVYNIALLC